MNVIIFNKTMKVETGKTWAAILIVLGFHPFLKRMFSQSILQREVLVFKLIHLGERFEKTFASQKVLST